MSDHDAGGLPPPSGPSSPGPGAPGGPWWRRRVVVLPIWAWGVLGVVAVAGGARLLLAGDDEAAIDVGDPEVTAPITVQRAQPQPSGPIGTFDPSASEGSSPTVLASTAAPTAAPSTAAATTVAAPTTSAVTTTTTTTAPTTTVAPTTTTAPTTTVAPTTTTAPTTTVAPTTVPTASTTPPTTTIPPTGPFVQILPRRERCRYGSDCLVAGFAITGFDHQPTGFVCEFSSGSRYMFRFDSLAVDLACSTADAPDSIVIEIDGVRSATVTTDDVGR